MKNAQVLISRFCLLSLLFLIFHSSSFAQSRPVTGRVVTGTNVPLEGVSVRLKGSQTGTATDRAGNYSIGVRGNSPVLVFSYVGFEEQEVTVGDGNVIDVQLAEGVAKLTDIVVVGYGTQRKREVTSAVTSIKQEDFNKGNVNDVAQLLQGKVAGLTISRSGGDPNGNFAIRLRGLSTVGQNSAPLIVVDGVPGSDINSVDPNDIASMDILKDGSAAAIYGTRGSAGVILITTKRGKAGRAQIDYNGYVSSESVDRTIPLMNATEFRETIQKLNSNNDFGGSTDWMDEITRNNALSHVHNLSLSGGSGQTTYRASVNYRDVEGIAITTGFKQLNARLNVEQKALNDKLKLSLMAGQTTRNSDIGWNRAFREAANYNPTAPVKSDDSAYLQYDGYFQNTSVNEHYNPVAMLRQNSNNIKLQRLNLNVQAEYELIKDLKILARYGYQKEDALNAIFINKFSFIDNRMINIFPINYSGNSSNGIAAQRNARSNNNLTPAAPMSAATSRWEWRWRATMKRPRRRPQVNRRATRPPGCPTTRPATPPATNPLRRNRFGRREVAPGPRRGSGRSAPAGAGNPLRRASCAASRWSLRHCTCWCCRTGSWAPRWPAHSYPRARWEARNPSGAQSRSLRSRRSHPTPPSVRPTANR